MVILITSFAVKKKELDAFIQKMFKKVAEEGMDAQRALGLIGVKAQQIVQDAFTSKGYGNWPENSPNTIEEKGSSQSGLFESLGADITVSLLT